MGDTSRRHLRRGFLTSTSTQPLTELYCVVLCCVAVMQALEMGRSNASASVLRAAAVPPPSQAAEEVGGQVEDDATARDDDAASSIRPAAAAAAAAIQQ